jgi:hypothetical protein
VYVEGLGTEWPSPEIVLDEALRAFGLETDTNTTSEKGDV